MMNKIKRVITILMLLTLVLINCSIIVSGDISVELSPQHPKPQDNVTFNVTISNAENITEVVILVEECSNEICYFDGFNETMSAVDNKYTTQITLKHEDATGLQYKIMYLTDDGWISEPSGMNMIKVSLNIPSDSENDTDNSNILLIGTIFIVILIMFIFLILYRRKR